MKKKSAAESKQTVHLILQKFLIRKQRSSPGFSIRRCAQEMEMDPGFLNRVLNGKKKLPLDRLPLIVKVLDIDPLGVKEIKKSLVYEYASEVGFDLEVQAPKSDSKKSESEVFQSFEEFQTDEGYTETLFQPWYKLALLELSTMSEFEPNMNLWSTKLNVPVGELERAWVFLVKKKLVVQNSAGQWRKSNKKIRFATKESQQNIRRFHKDILTKAVEEMYRHVDKKSFENRFITSATLVVSEEQVQAIRIRLQEMILEIVDSAAEGENQNLYAVNFSFFPLINLTSKD